MTKILIDEATVKLVLEALELNNDEWKSLADSGDCGWWRAEDQSHYKQTNEAITALKALAEQPAQQEPDWLTGKQRIYLAQAWAMLDDYALDQRSKGNDSFANGAEASSHEIKAMLTAQQPARCAPAEDGVCESLDCPNHKPAQQEPVAWMYEDMMGLVGVRVQKEKPIVARPVTPLYTSPPAQRTWVGLTDEEKHEAVSDEIGRIRDYEDYADAIEAKLRSKNEDRN